MRRRGGGRSMDSNDPLPTLLGLKTTEMNLFNLWFSKKKEFNRKGITPSRFSPIHSANILIKLFPLRAGYMLPILASRAVRSFTSFALECNMCKWPDSPGCEDVECTTKVHFKLYWEMASSGIHFRGRYKILLILLCSKRAWKHSLWIRLIIISKLLSKNFFNNELHKT